MLRARRVIDVTCKGASLWWVMLRSFRIGTLFGFPIRVHFSFVLLLGAALLWTGGAGGVLFLAMIAASVIVHELGHALLARRLGVPIAGIGLHIFGGAAEMVGLPRRPDDEIAIAAAGPTVSFVAGGAGVHLGGHHRRSTLCRCWPG